MPKHTVVTHKCSLNLIVAEDEPPYLLVTAEMVNGVTTRFALLDQAMLRQLATDILEELPEPKKRTSKPKAKKKVH